MWKILFALFISIASSVNASAAVLDFKEIDYGVPGNPYTNAILPGQSGTVFFTLANPSAENMRDLTLRAQTGACVTGAVNSLHASEMAAGEMLRFPMGLGISISEECARGISSAEILLIGTYIDAAGTERRVWSKATFTVAPVPTVTFRAENINLVIPDRSITDYTFTVTQNLQIQRIGFYIDLRHTYIGDLTITLIHPSGVQVVLHDRGGEGARNIVRRWGWEGDPFAGMNNFVGLTTRGSWILRMQDNEGGDIGALNTVELRAAE